MNLYNMLEIRMKRKRCVEGNFTVENYNTVLKSEGINHEKVLSILFDLDEQKFNNDVLKDRVRDLFNNKEAIESYFSDEVFLDKLHSLIEDSNKKDFVFRLLHIMCFGQNDERCRVKEVLNKVVEGKDTHYTKIAYLLYENVSSDIKDISILPDIIDKVEELNLIDNPTRVLISMYDILKVVETKEEMEEILNFISERENYMIPLISRFYVKEKNSSVGAYGDLRMFYMKKYFPIVECNLEKKMYGNKKKDLKNAIEAFSDSVLEECVDELYKKSSILYSLRCLDVKKVLDPIENAKYKEACCKLHVLSKEKKSVAENLIEMNNFGLEEEKLNMLADLATSYILKSEATPDFLYSTYLQVGAIDLFLEEKEKFKHLLTLFSNHNYEKHNKQLVRSMKYILSQANNKECNSDRYDLAFAVNKAAIYYNDNDFDNATEILRTKKNAYWAFQLLLSERVFSSEEKDKYLKMCESDEIEYLYDTDEKEYQEGKLFEKLFMGVSNDLEKHIKEVDTSTIFPEEKAKVKRKTNNKKA